MKVVNPLLERCFQFIEFLAEEPRAYRLGVISERLGLQKGAAHRLLAALCDMGWVEQEPETGFYRLTLRLAIMGQRVLLATRIPDLTRPVLQKLAEETQELVRMAIVEGERLSWGAFVQGRRTLDALRRRGHRAKCELGNASGQRNRGDMAASLGANAYGSCRNVAVAWRD